MMFPSSPFFLYINAIVGIFGGVCFGLRGKERPLERFDKQAAFRRALIKVSSTFSKAAGFLGTESLSRRRPFHHPKDLRPAFLRTSNELRKQKGDIVP